MTRKTNDRIDIQQPIAISCSVQLVTNQPLSNTFGSQDNCTGHLVEGNLSLDNHGLSWTNCSHSHSQTGWQRVAKNWHKQITQTNCPHVVSVSPWKQFVNDALLCKRVLDSAGCQLVIVWLYSYITTQSPSPNVILQLNCRDEATMSHYLWRNFGFRCIRLYLDSDCKYSTGIYRECADSNRSQTGCMQLSTWPV